jgi:hypothetical protein
MPNQFPETQGVMGMFTVLEVRGPLLKLMWWDQDDEEIDNIYAGHLNEVSIEVGSVHMMELVAVGGLIKIKFCSPAYEQFDVEYAADEDEDGLTGDSRLH